MRRGRRWLFGIVTALVILVIAIVFGLPPLVGHIARQRIEAMTGRPATIGATHVNLFTRRLRFEDVRVAGPPGGGAPLFELRRLDARFRLWALLRGGVHLDALTLGSPVVRLARTPSGALDIEDVIRHYESLAPSKPVAVVLDRLTVEGGRVIVTDEAATPAERWDIGAFALDARDLATTADADSGRVSASFRVAGGRVELSGENIALRPLGGRVALTLSDVALASLGAYLPASAPRPDAGTLSATLHAGYDAEHGLTADGRVDVATLGLVGPAPTARLDLSDLHLAAADLRSRGAPGRLSLAAALPDGGRITGQGPVALSPLDARIALDVRDVALALLAPFLPPDAVRPVDGRLAAALDLRYTPAGGLGASGTAQLTKVALARPGQATPLVTEDRMDVTLGDLAVRDGALVVGHAVVRGAPTLIDASRTPAPRFAFRSLAVTVDGLGTRARGRLAVDAAVEPAGTLTARGEVGVLPVSADLRVTVRGADLTRLEPYMAGRAPVDLVRGRLDADVAVRYAEAARVDGTFTARGLRLTRVGQREPFIEHPALRGTITALTYGDGTLALQRLALTGAPTLIDATATPPQRFETQSVSLVVDDFSVPARGPARLTGDARLTDGSSSHLTGTVNASTLAVDARLTFQDVDLTRARGYLPASTGLGVGGGRGAMTLTLRHRRDTGTRIDADGTLADLTVTAQQGRLVVTDPRVAVKVTGFTVNQDVLGLEGLTLDGAPRVRKATGAESQEMPLASLRLALGAVRWPRGPAAPVTLEARFGESETIRAQGTIDPAARHAVLTVNATRAPVAALAVLAPVEAPAGGRLNARLAVDATFGDAPAVGVSGEARAFDLTLGAGPDPPIKVTRVEVHGLDVHWPGAVRAESVVIGGPSIRIDREADGTFPLRAMLGSGDAGDGSASPTTRPAAPPPPAPTAVKAGPGFDLAIGRLTLDDGTIRFVDRTTTPAFIEEITHQAISIERLSTDPSARSPISVQGIVAANAALDLRGEIAPFGRPFFLDVKGELRNFSVSRTNPYLARLLAWIVQRGQLTTQVHYRVEGDQLEGTNDVHVQQLDVARAAQDEQTARTLGVPLGLAVALLKDAKGDINVSVPVSGNVSQPEFSFADAIQTALRHIVTGLVTGPFRAIGRVFQRDGETTVGIEPVDFSPGTATIDPGDEPQIQKLADVLRASPHVRLSLQPVVSDADLRALKTETVTARIQRLQRAESLPTFEAAARLLFHRAFPGVAVPKTVDEVVTRLVEREPVRQEATQTLATRRLNAARQQLVDAGVEPERLVAGEPPPAGGSGQGRVEFQLQPAS